MSKWLLIDNLMPNKPVLIRIESIKCISWDSGTLCIEFSDETAVEYECEKSIFVEIAQMLDIGKEIE